MFLMLCNPYFWKDFCGLAAHHLSGKHFAGQTRGFGTLKSMGVGSCTPSRPSVVVVVFSPTTCQVLLAHQEFAGRAVLATLHKPCCETNSTPLRSQDLPVSPVPQVPPVLRAGNACRWLYRCNGNHYKLKESLNQNHRALFLPRWSFLDCFPRLTLH